MSPEPTASELALAARALWWVEGLSPLQRRRFAELASQAGSGELADREATELRYLWKVIGGEALASEARMLARGEEVPAAPGFDPESEGDPEPTPEERRRFFNEAQRFTGTLGVETKLGPFLVSTEDVVVSRGLFAERRRGDGAMIARALVAIEASGGVVPTGTFVDVGANLGTAAVAAVKAHGFERALAIEPAPATFSLLIANLLMNGLGGRVGARQLAVSDREGRAELVLDRYNWGNHRLLRAGDPRDWPDPEAARAEVDVRSIDGLVESGDVVAGEEVMLWLDVQGPEGQVLAGAGALTGSGAAVVAELYPAQLREACGLELFLGAAGKHYGRFADLGRRDDRGVPQARPIAELEALVGELGTGFTDILLLR